MDTIRQVRERNLIEIAQTRNIEANDAMLLQRISHRLHSLDEASCNWGLTERQEKRVVNLEKQANEIASKYKLQAYHQSDPRGWSLYLLDKSVRNPEVNYYPEGLGVCPH